MKKFFLTIVFIFALGAAKAQSPISDTKNLSDSTLRYGSEIYENSDVAPAPPGGIAKFRDGIQVLLKQPLDATKELKGEIRIVFVIERDGKLTDLRVLRQKASTEKTIAVMRFMKTHQDWSPGTVRNISVRTRVVLSVPATEHD
jgi:hypothetical protein